MKPQFTLRLNVGDEQDTDLETLLSAARKVRETLNLEAVEFEFFGSTYTVSKSGTVRTAALSVPYYIH